MPIQDIKAHPWMEGCEFARELSVDDLKPKEDPEEEEDKFVQEHLCADIGTFHLTHYVRILVRFT